MVVTTWSDHGDIIHPAYGTAMRTVLPKLRRGFTSAFAILCQKELSGAVVQTNQRGSLQDMTVNGAKF